MCFFPLSAPATRTVSDGQRDLRWPRPRLMFLRSAHRDRKPVAILYPNLEQGNPDQPNSIHTKVKVPSSNISAELTKRSHASRDTKLKNYLWLICKCGYGVQLIHYDDEFFKFMGKSLTKKYGFCFFLHKQCFLY